MKPLNSKLKHGINDLESHTNEQFAQMRTSPVPFLAKISFYIIKQKQSCPLFSTIPIIIPNCLENKEKKQTS